MAWFRAMGVDAVFYHQETVMGRGDDHPGRALAYYGSRGETPLRWGGAEAEALGLTGEVTPEAYEAIFGPGGATHPVIGEQMTKTRVPGFELVVSAHKSVAMLGVIGRADDMHTILDAETGGTMAWLEHWMQTSGGRRGRAATPTPTSGLAYAVTRHGTSRAGDPAPHDHVLIANLTRMLDVRGGHKGLHSALVRDWAEAATMIGRLESAAVAIKLGYAIEADNGKSGQARDWRIVGIPEDVMELFSKRADQIQDYLDERGLSGYRARNVAARKTRTVKRGTGVDELLPQWISELEQLGWTVDDLAEALDEARTTWTGLKPALTGKQVNELAEHVLSSEGPLLQRSKVFTRTRLVAEIAPMLYGYDPAELDRVLEHILTSDLLVPLVGSGPEHHYTTANVLATEEAIADQVAALASSAGPILNDTLVQTAIRTKESEIGGPLTDGQRATIEAVCGSGRAVELVVGVAGAGKTTAVDAASTALQEAGYRVIGTATSGQAAQTLGREAGIEARTIRSLLHRLDHRTDQLDARTVLIVDEAAMSADVDLAGLLLAARHVRAKVVLVGDPQQLSPVGPGGALAAVLEVHPEIVTKLSQNVRQHDPAERDALRHLREGHIDQALDFYRSHQRIHAGADDLDVMTRMVAAWADDIEAGADTLLMAWRRDHVAGLNQLARAIARQLGWISGGDLEAPGGNLYAVGDPVVFLAPSFEGQLVTSQRATVVGIDHHTQTLHVLTDDERTVRLRGEEIGEQRLAHGYAVTVHRQQGGTCDRAHYFAAGGGQELAYVALSRARAETHIYTVAADIDEAQAQLAEDWVIPHADQWVTATHEPANPLQAQRAQLEALLQIANQGAPPNVGKQLSRANARADKLRQDLQDLKTGIGDWRDQPSGRAVQRLHAAQRARQQAVNEFRHATILSRRTVQRRLTNLEKAEALAYQDWQTTIQPVIERLEDDLAAIETRIPELQHAQVIRQQWLDQHPDRAANIKQLERELLRLDDPTRARYLDRLDQATRQIPGHDIEPFSHDIGPPGLDL